MKQANYTWLEAVKYAPQLLTTDDLETMAALADSEGDSDALRDELEEVRDELEEVRDELEEVRDELEEVRDDLTVERDSLKAALKAILFMDVKGHDLADRLQFSDSGRAILAQALAALKGEF